MSVSIRFRGRMTSSHCNRRFLGWLFPPHGLRAPNAHNPKLMQSESPRPSPGITPRNGGDQRRNPLPREGHCRCREWLIEPPCPPPGSRELLFTPLRRSHRRNQWLGRDTDPLALRATGESTLAQRGRLSAPQPALAAILQPCVALNYKLALSTGAIRKDVEELACPSPCLRSPSPGAGRSGRHSDLLRRPQQEQVCTWSFYFCSPESPGAGISQERRSGLSRDAPGTRFGSAAPMQARPRPSAKLTCAQTRSYGFTSVQQRRLSFNSIPNAV